MKKEEYLNQLSEYKRNYFKYDKLPENFFLHTKLSILCPDHGPFTQTARIHIYAKYSCYSCGVKGTAKSRSSSTDDFILKSINKFGDRFNYSKTNYKHNAKKVTLTCKQHGDLYVTPNSHLNSHTGCFQCGLEKNRKEQINNRLSTEEFIKRSIKTHGDLYDYSKTVYISTKTKVSIICRKHGEFKQNPYSHFKGFGCVLCSRTSISKKSQKWLDCNNIENQYREFRIKAEKRDYIVDGFKPETNTVYEYLGDFWHGGKRFDPGDINPRTKCTYKELYEKTIERLADIKALGFNVVVEWET